MIKNLMTAGLRDPVDASGAGSSRPSTPIHAEEDKLET